MHAHMKYLIFAFLLGLGFISNYSYAGKLDDFEKSATKSEKKEKPKKFVMPIIPCHFLFQAIWQPL